MKGFKNLWKWGKKYLFGVIAIIILNCILQWLYSYLPLLVQYAFKLLRGENAETVNLPSFVKAWYETKPNIISGVVAVSISMIALQTVRSILRFTNNYLQGAIVQDIGYDMRIKLYNHICDLSYSYYNRVDTGDLIQRSTSDVDDISSIILL